MRIIISNFFDVYLHKYLIRKNYKLVFFAYLAQFCNAFLALIFLPLYFSNLKVEEYGLIGFYTLIQSIFSIVEVSIFPVVIDRIQKLNINNIKKNLINYIKNIKILIIIFGVTIIILNILIYILLNYEWLNYKALNK